MRMPSSLARRRRLPPARPTARCPLDDEVGRALLGLRHLLRDRPSSMLRESRTHRCSCSVPLRRPKKDDLPAPLRPTRPIFSPGLKLTDARSSTTLTPRRSVTLRMEIIGSYFERNGMIADRTCRAVAFPAACVKCRLRFAAPTGHKARRPPAHGCSGCGPANIAVNDGSGCRFDRSMHQLDGIVQPVYRPHAW